MSKNCLNCGAPRESNIRAECSYCGTPPAISLTQTGSAFTVEIRNNIQKNLQGNPDNEAEENLSLAILYLLNNLPILASPIVDNIIQNQMVLFIHLLLKVYYILSWKDLFKYCSQ